LVRQSFGTPFAWPDSQAPEKADCASCVASRLKMSSKSSWLIKKSTGRRTGVHFWTSRVADRTAAIRDFQE